MIEDDLKSMNRPTGLSRQAILKYICLNNNMEADMVAGHLRAALKKGLSAGRFKMPECLAREPGPSNWDRRPPRSTLKLKASLYPPN